MNAGLFAPKSVNWYYVHQSPRSGKLRPTRTTLRTCWRHTHRSDEMAAVAVVSCVGRRRLAFRDVAHMPRRLSGTGWLPSDRQRLTSAHAFRSTLDKTRQRRPSTWWAIHRKVFCAVSWWTTLTKDQCLGTTERVACYLRCLLHCRLARSRKTPAAGSQEAIARRGCGAQRSSAFPSFGWQSPPFQCFTLERVSARFVITAAGNLHEALIAADDWRDAQ